MSDFILTADHVKLLRELRTEWNGGVPGINSKRPFGDSDVLRSVCRVLGWVPDLVIQDLPMRGRVWGMLEELPVALEIVLTYLPEAPRLGRWRPVAYRTWVWEGPT